MAGISREAVHFASLAAQSIRAGAGLDDGIAK